MGMLTGKRIAFIIAPEQFRDEEYFQPKVILQSYGAIVQTAAKGNPNEVTGIKGGKAHPDIPLESVTPETYDVLVLVGGKGVKKYFKDRQVLEIAAAFYHYPRIIGAICSAPGILAQADLVKKKTLTSFIDEKPILIKAGAKWSDEPLVIDGLLVTANGPESALVFGEKIAQILQKQ